MIALLPSLDNHMPFRRLLRMRWLRDFFRKPGLRGDKDAAKASTPSRPLQNSFGIPVPEGADPALFERVPLAKKRGRRRTPEEIAEDRAEFLRAMLAKNRALAEFERERAQKAGCIEFHWSTTGDSDVCAACASMHNRRFRYDALPTIGLPGTHQCSDKEVCRCIALPVVPP